MQILTGERPSDRLMRKMASEALCIPETLPEQPEETGGNEIVKTASTATSKPCPECNSPMRAEGAMEKCACGYARATAEAMAATKKVAKTAAETSVSEYYSKIYPKDYVSDMKATGPVTPKGGKPVSYGHVPVTKPVGDVGKSARVLSAKELRRVRAEGYDGAGSVTVDDAHPESGLSAGSAGEKPHEPKKQAPPSANSVCGPEVVSSIGTGLADPGSVSMPDIGGPQPGKSAKNDPWITREVLATICPECARSMQAKGIKKVRASVIARQLEAAMLQANFKNRR